MSDAKKYNFGNHELTLATPTPRKLSAFLGATEIELSDIATREKQTELGMKLFKIQTDADKIKKLMEVCLISCPDDIEWLDVDSRSILEVITDFFSQFK